MDDEFASIITMLEIAVQNAVIYIESKCIIIVLFPNYYLFHLVYPV